MFLFDMSSLVNSLNFLKKYYFKISANIFNKLVYTSEQSTFNCFTVFFSLKWNRQVNSLVSMSIINRQVNEMIHG